MSIQQSLEHQSLITRLRDLRAQEAPTPSDLRAGLSDALNRLEDVCIHLEAWRIRFHPQGFSYDRTKQKVTHARDGLLD